MRTLGLVILLVGCSRTTAPIATLVGGAMTVGGIVDIAVHNKCPDGCVAPPAGFYVAAIGIPLLVIGGLSWLSHLGDDKPGPAAHPSAGSPSAAPP
jgi:hypothetical protein